MPPTESSRYLTASQIAAEHGFTPRHWIRERGR